MDSDDDDFDFAQCHGISYSDGSEYEGHWDGKEKEGFGVFKFRDGSVYMGNLHKGLGEGFGLHRFSSKGCYIGEFKEGLYHGYGIFTRQEGSRFEGKFIQGCIEGCGMLTYPGGDREQGRWSGVKLMESGDSTPAVKAARAAANAARRLVNAYCSPGSVTPRTSQDMQNSSWVV